LLCIHYKNLVEKELTKVKNTTSIPITIKPVRVTVNVPHEPKNGTIGTFFGCQPTNISKTSMCKIWTQFLSQEKISQITIVIIFSKMSGTYFHNLSCSQLKARIYSSELYSQKRSGHFGSSPLARFTKKFWAHFYNLCMPK